MKPLWRRMMEGRTRHKVRVRVWPILLTFMVTLTLHRSDLDKILSNLVEDSSRTFRKSAVFVTALDFDTRGEIKFNSFSSLDNSVKVPGFKVGEERISGIPQDKVLYALAESKLSHPESSEEEEAEEEEETISIKRTVEPQVLKRLESKFLKMFGMQQRPKKSEKHLKIPKYLLDLYQKQSGDDMPIPTSNLHLPGRNTRTANTVRTFYNQPGLPQEEKMNHNSLKFNLDSIPASELVTGAELRVPFIFHKNEDEESEVFTVKVLLHDVIKAKGKKFSKNPHHLKEAITQPIDSKRVSIPKRRNGTTTFYLTFDVFPAVSRWISTKNPNHGLLVEVLGFTKEGQQVDIERVQERHKLRVKRQVASGSGEDESSKKGTEVGAVEAVIAQDNNEKQSSHPIVLFTYSDDGHNGRKTRDAKTLSRQYRAAQQNQQQKRRRNHRNKNRKRNLCARHNMFVDFTDVGWNDWIVAPPGYHAFHCSGECPFPMAEHLNATNHAVIQALVNSMQPGVVPPPCCVPSKYSALSLLYTDSSDKIVLKNYNEMVVDSCGCS